MPPTKSETLASLQLSRYTAWHSLAAYHFMRRPNPSDEPFKVGIRDNDLILDPSAEEHFTGYQVAFVPGDFRDFAERVVRKNFHYYVVDTYDTVSRYAAGCENPATITESAAFIFCRHLRNAFAHGGRWNFIAPLRAPVQWRNMNLTQELHGTRAEDLVSLWHMTQLAAELTLLVDQEHTDPGRHVI